MSSPLETPEFGHLYVGDTHDDDGAVIDSFLVEVDAPAALPQNSQEVDGLTRPKPMTRLLTGTAVLDVNTVGAQMIVPADPNRMSVRVSGFSLNATPGATDYASVADEIGKATAAGGGAAWRLRSGTGHTMDGATNAIWVYPGAGVATNNFEVTWVAVTK